MSTFRLDRQQIRRAFGRAAASYERHDALQRAVQQTLLERLDFLLESPQRILDLGAGTGRGTAALKRRYPKARVIAVDLALPMLQQASRHSHWRRRFDRVAGEATQLPFADHSIDLLHSNLCIQWCDDLDALFAECVRVLRPGGFIALSTFGPDTLRELRAAWAETDSQSHVGRFLDMHDLGDAMIRAGLRDPVLDVDRYTLTYAEPADLARELKGLGATHADSTRNRGLTGKARWQRMLGHYERMRDAEGRIPASWETITAHAWGPATGQARRGPGGGDIATFSLDDLRGSRRRRT